MSAEAERLLSAGQASAVAGALDALELQVRGREGG